MATTSLKTVCDRRDYRVIQYCLIFAGSQTLPEHINGAGVESMQAKWEEMFGEREENMGEEVQFNKTQRKVDAEKTLKEHKNRTTKRKTIEKEPSRGKSTSNKSVKDG